MAAFPTQFASVASLSAPAPLLSTGGPKPSPGNPGSPGIDFTPRSMPHALGTPGAQGHYTSSAAAAAAAQYSPAAAGLLAYSRLAPGFGDTMYGASFANPAGGLYGLGADPSALYVNPLTGTPYDLKENAEIWRNLSQQATCFAYDPTGLYSYGYGGMDLSLAARRKNATKENTGTLKAWLQEHKKNPYPTKGEKIMLAIITKMTLTQVSTWFANARRRLKKDNKMTWSPRNKTDSDDDDDDNMDNKAASSTSTNLNGERHDLRDDSDERDDADAGQVDVTGCDSDDEDALMSLRTSQADPLRPGLPATTVPVMSRQDESRSRSPSPVTSRNTTTSSETTPQRPRIWSLADVLGPTTNSGGSNDIEARPSAVVTSPNMQANIQAPGLSYPMPLKPTASSALQGYVSPATAASLRHWSDRSPYPIPVSLHGGLPSHFGLHSPHNSRPNGLHTPPERVTINGTSPNGLPGAFSQHPGLPSYPITPNDRLRTHASSISPEEPGEIRKLPTGSQGVLAGPHQSSPSSSPSPSSPGLESPLSLTAFKPVPRSKPPTYAQS